MPQVEYYIAPDGSCPLKEYYDTLDDERELPYATRMVDLLEEHGYKLHLHRAHAAPLRDGIFELRYRIKRKQYRTLYFFYYQESIVVTHGFYKPDSAVNPKEIDKAIKYKEEYFARKEKKR